MNQLAIEFHARRTDPSTSHRAAERVKEFAGEHHKLILAALNRQDGLTPYQIADASGLDYVAVQRRVSELARAGQIVADGERLGPSGRACRVWFIA